VKKIIWVTFFRNCFYVEKVEVICRIEEELENLLCFMLMALDTFFKYSTLKMEKKSCGTFYEKYVKNDFFWTEIIALLKQIWAFRTFLF
jgi:hypothetical protein